MKLERIHIERYGAWQNLELPVDSDGVSVFYGPNEAGKTTLMRFVQGVLYGFHSADLDRIPGRPESGSWGGSLQLSLGAETWIIRRTGPLGTRGLVTARRLQGGVADTTGENSGVPGDITGDIHETVYENIFAIGLCELQELATLESREVAEHIYSLSLGLDGQQLLALTDVVRTTGTEILDIRHSSGRLSELYQALDEIDTEIGNQAEGRQRHTLLTQELRKWEDSIVDLKQRQQGLENQLHGHEYLERVYDPWVRLRDSEKELEALPHIPDFPEDGLQSLEEIETELAAARERRSALQTEARTLISRSREAQVDSNFRRYAPVLQSFVDQRDWIAELRDQAIAAETQSTGLQEQLNSQLEELGQDWNTTKLQQVDTSHQGSSCLTHQGREFQKLNRRTRQLKRRYRKLSKQFHHRQDQLQQLQTQLGENTVVHAIARARDELSQIEDLSRLRLRQSELNQRRSGVASQLYRLQINPSLPEWVYATFYAFGITGAVLGVIGIWTGLTANAIGGFVYLVAGLLAGGMTYALKEHFEREFCRTMTELRGELRELELRLTETREAIGRIAPVITKLRLQSDDDAKQELITSAADRVAQAVAEAATTPIEDTDERSQQPLVPIPETSAITAHGVESSLPIVTIAPETEVAGTETSAGIATDQATTRPADPAASVQASQQNHRPEAPGLSEADLLRENLARIAELEDLARAESWVEQTRTELIAMRAQLKEAQRDFGVARQTWCSHLKEQGLDETLDVDEALSQRDLVARTGLLYQRLSALQEDSHIARQMYERFRKRVEECGHLLQQWEADYSDPVSVLDRWAQALSQFAKIQRQERKLRREAKKRRAEAAGCRDRIRELENSQAAILVRTGSISREDFEQRAELLERRFEIQEQVDHARQELETVASTEQTMAIVESDLEEYDAAQNRLAIETIGQELDDLSLDVEDAFETLGRIKQELHALENDRQPAELRFEREQLVSQIRDLAEEWFALEWSSETLNDLRIEFEKNHQPPILNRARDYLQRLSAGRYTGIWTPLGQRTLCVDDADGHTLQVESLSRGTREQLFLAIRLALIEHFSQQGIDLPVILDDILVNFDHERTRAAIEELIHQTSADRQILFFTCHRHLAELFEHLGVDTVTLPDRRAQSGGKLAG